MSESAGEAPLEFRASDAERERAVEALRGAAAEGRLTVDELEERVRSAYTMSTRRELQRLIGDVSADSLAAPVPAAESAAAVRSGTEIGATGRILSIMSGHSRRGRWHVSSRCTVVNVMGGTDLDLREAVLAGPVTELRVYSVMGGGEIRVPDHLDVRISEFAFMGGNDVKLGDRPAPPPGAPVVHIRLVSIMAGFSVKRARLPVAPELATSGE